MNIPTPQDLGITAETYSPTPKKSAEELATEYLLKLIDKVKIEVHNNRRPVAMIESDPGVDYRILSRLAAENGWQVNGSWFGSASDKLAELPKMRGDEGLKIAPRRVA